MRTLQATAVAMLFLSGPLRAQSQGQAPAQAGEDTIVARYLDELSNDSPADVAPEPASMALVATGLVSLLGVSYRQRRKERKP